MPIALADLIDPKQIALNLRASTQAEAMREIVDLLEIKGEDSDQNRAKRTALDA